MFGWFHGCSTAAEIKAKFRELAFEHHPDRGGDTRTMQEVIDAYHAGLKAIHGQEQPAGDDGKARTYYYNAERETAASAMVGKLLALGMVDVDMWLIGTWIWVTGDTKPHREALKALKLRWHSKRVCWYWSPPGSGKRRYNSRVSLSDLADTYGARRFASEQAERERDTAGGAVAVA